MDDSSRRSPCWRQAQGAALVLREGDVARRQRCAEGAHIVLIGTSALNSMTMRGMLLHSVLRQSLARHGAKSSYVFVTDATNSSGRDSAMLEAHFDRIGGPSACFVIKYSVAWVGAACRRRGAIVLVDSIDNKRAFSPSGLMSEHYVAMDAIAVQTHAHASLLASWGHTAVVLPHSHGNLGQWSVARGVRPSVRGVGFVVSVRDLLESTRTLAARPLTSMTRMGLVLQDPKNMPSREDMTEIVRACCRANATLYVIGSGKDGLRLKPQNCSDSSDGLALSREHRTHLRSRTCVAHPPAGHHLGIRATALLDNLTTTPLRDETHQRKHYPSAELLEQIDVGIVWRPGHQPGGRLVVQNRPPTRMHWWWSHSIPVIGYPMEAYLDAARRIDYPLSLLNLTNSRQIQSALQRLAPAEERSCLQRASAHGALLSSPSHSSLELLAAICAVADRCGKPARWPASSTRRHTIGGWARSPKS